MLTLHKFTLQIYDIQFDMIYTYKIFLNYKYLLFIYTNIENMKLKHGIFLLIQKIIVKKFYIFVNFV